MYICSSPLHITAELILRRARPRHRVALVQADTTLLWPGSQIDVFTPEAEVYPGMESSSGQHGFDHRYQMLPTIR